MSYEFTYLQILIVLWIWAAVSLCCYSSQFSNTEFMRIFKIIGIVFFPIMVVYIALNIVLTIFKLLVYFSYIGLKVIYAKSTTHTAVSKK